MGKRSLTLSGNGENDGNVIVIYTKTIIYLL